MKYEEGKTYTLTGDEPWFGQNSVTLSNWHGSEYFPAEVTVLEIDDEGDVWFLDKSTGYVYVVDSSANTESEMVNHPLHYNGQSAAMGERNTVEVPDRVNHPAHYNSHPKNIEAIDVIEDNPFVNLGNAMKYLWRVSWGSKGHDDEDLAKAVWYIERERSRRAKEN